MPDLVSILQAGTANPWVYLPVAVLLGALHALEPGHSKSLMAAFIIAIRGTSAQALLLGVSAAVGHTIIVWALALAGLWLGDKLILDRAEPWLVLVSGLMIVALAARLIWTIVAAGRAHRHHDHDHGHDHDHAHHHDLPHHHGHDHPRGQDRSAGRIGRTDPDASSPAEADEDAHAAAHRREIEARFAGRSSVSAGEIVWFGFTGGLLPCPAAIAVLLVCLQLKALTLGIAMVAAFSLGLAITMVAVGVAAAWGARKAAGAWAGFGVWADRLPLISGSLVLLLGVAVTLRGVWMLSGA